MTALMWAAMDNSNPEVVKMLLEAGADVSAVDEDGHDALWWYAQKNKNKQVKEILEKAKNENPIKYYFKKFIKFIGDNKEYVLIILIAFLILIELCKIMRRK